jgi:PAS domain-containing protein
MDRVDFIKEMKQVPVMSFEQFSKVSKMLFALANEISDKAYCNFKLKIEVAEREKEILKRIEAEEQFKALFERSIDATFLVDLTTGQYLNANKAA